jgi:BlaI family penicillinase repressor
MVVCDNCNSFMKGSIRITEAEWEVMAVIWKRSPVAAATIAEELEKERQWSLATVRTLLRRLVNKGALRQENEGKRLIYMPRVSMEDCVRRESESFWDRVLGRAPSASILHLVKKADLSPEDIQELRRILREKEKKS